MNPIAIGTPVTFYWLNGSEVAGIVASSRVEDSITYYGVVLFDPNNIVGIGYYPSTVSDTSKNPGSFQPYNAPIVEPIIPPASTSTIEESK